MTWPGSRTPCDSRELGQAPEVAQVGLDRVRAVPRLEREEVAEALEPEVASRRARAVRDRHALAAAPAGAGDTSATSAGPTPSSSAGQVHQPVLVGADGPVG